MARTRDSAWRSHSSSRTPQIRVPLILQFGFAGRGLDGQFLFALLELRLEGQFLLLQFLLQARVGVARLGFELAFQFRSAAAQFLFGLLLEFAQTNLRLRLQLLLALFELDLGGFLPLLHFLFPAGVDFKGAGVELALKLRLAAAGLLLNPGLFLRQAGVKAEGQFLLALFQLVFEVLFALAQCLAKLQLLPVHAMFLLAHGLLQLAGGVLLGL